MAGISITISFPPLAEGWAGTPDEFLQEIAGSIIFDATGAFLTGQIGGAEPVTDVGLFVDGKKLKVWDDDLAQYAPIETVPIGAAVPYFGTGAVPENYLFCDNAEYSKVGDYAALYAVIGDRHKRAGDDSDKFRVPDLRGRSLTGAGAGEYALIPTDNAVLPGNITQRAIGDYWGAEWGTLRQDTQAGAPTNRIIYDTRPTGRRYNNISNYSGLDTPTTACEFIIRYR